jgi:hypothetical protein
VTVLRGEYHQRSLAKKFEWTTGARPSRAMPITRTKAESTKINILSDVLEISRPITHADLLKLEA